MADEKRVLPLFVIDAFTSKPFSGNPAAVCLVGSKHLSDQMLQKIAQEMNLSDTGFILEKNSQDTYSQSTCFGLRWFTPTCEVPLCGHATLASAAVLFNCLGNPNKEVTFETLSGNLKARKEGSSICLDFPLNPCEPWPLSGEDPSITKLIRAVVGDLAVKELEYNKTTNNLLLCLQPSFTRKDLEGFCPDFQAMTSAHSAGIVRGVIVTLQGTESNGCVDTTGAVYDFISRYFAPWRGVPEDPVTGSAHTVLASYWSTRLKKTDLYARQCSSRGGELTIHVREDNRVDITGQVVLVLQGSLYL
ncbi:phenazine biosynthesis-like domain-containing protein [Porites lutea]|uniref:phenazine biosynthesis-like domain-containing protein n=1 Tax=Porites lutea TaxID=51062 RepID=UPI003CC69823